MKHGIRFQIMIRMIAILTVVLMAFAAVSFYYNATEMRKSIYQRGTYDAQRNLAQIDSEIDEIYQFSQWLSTNETVRAFLLNREYATKTQRIVSIARLMEHTQVNLLLTRYVDSFCLVDKDGDAYWSTCPYDSFFIDWFKAHALSGEPLSQQQGFTPVYRIPGQKVYPVSQRLISYTSGINRIVSGSTECIGQAIVNLDIDSLMTAIDGAFSQVGMIDPKGRLMYLSEGDPEAFLKVASTLQGDFSQAGDYYYFENTIPGNGWRMISVLDSRVISHTLDITVLLTVVCALLSVLLIFTFVFPKLMRISRQIVLLDKAMARYASGEQEVQVDRLGGTRELIGIADGFNSMVVRTNQYLKDKLESQRAAQRISFELLLAKINPHFIYNTLNSVIYLARQHRHDEIIELTSAFICLLQDSIHRDRRGPFATVATEVDVVEKYITIQRYRYADRFTYAARFDESLGGELIPRNVLQPLVENAILHGVCPLDRPGHIELDVFREGETLAILVQDDGVGMDEALIEKLLAPQAEDEQEAEPSRMRSVGIQNVVGKLRYLYPDRHRFVLANRPEGGAQVRIEIDLAGTGDA